MENEVQPITSPTQPLPQIPNPVVISPTTNWSKILIFTILGLVVVTGSVFAGIQIGKNQTPNQEPIVSQPTLTPSEALVSPTILATTPTLTIAPTIALKTYTTPKLPTLGFPSVTFKYPADWIFEEKDDGLGILNLKLSKGGYELTFYQAPMGGSVCLFDDSPNFDGPSMDFRSLKYTEINSNIGILRYFVTQNDSQIYTFCQKGNQNFTSLGIGALEINTPTKTDPKIFQEAIDIVKLISIN